MTDPLLRLVRAADPLAGSPGSALVSDPATVLQGIRERLTPDNRPRRPRALLLVAGLVLAAVVAAGIAVAKDINPFAGIGAADRPRGAYDVLEPAVAAWIERWNTAADQINGRADKTLTSFRLLPESVRFVRALPSGRRFYVLSTNTNLLCILVAPPRGQSGGGSIGCGDHLSRVRPTTIGAQRRGKQTPLLTYGVARDDVAAVSFMTRGRETTIPVEHNVWAYEGPSGALATLTVHLRNGTTQTLTH